MPRNDTSAILEGGLRKFNALWDESGPDQRRSMVAGRLVARAIRFVGNVEARKVGGAFGDLPLMVARSAVARAIRLATLDDMFDADGSNLSAARALGTI